MDNGDITATETRPPKLKILFYAPFKPLGHSRPSGDLVIATGLYRFLEDRGHRLQEASRLRCRWIYWKPWMLPKVLAERRRLFRRVKTRAPDLWLTYHAYYKGPDVLGPQVSRRARIPYVVFQGAYATKYRRDWRTLAGFLLNRHALLSARHVFANKRVDVENLRRLLPAERVSYAAPGIYPQDFAFDAAARRSLRRRWQVRNEAVILTAAMLRPGVKAAGVDWVIRSCGRLLRHGQDLRLVVVGDGSQKAPLMQLAEKRLPGKSLFVGRQPRSEMFKFYSAGDLFVFPGIGESLGMVFLEAQSCGLPVVAFGDAGVPEVVKDGETGILTPLMAAEAFDQTVKDMLTNADRRRDMGRAAQAYIRQAHDLSRNYVDVENRLIAIAAADRAKRPRNGSRT